MVAAPSRSGRGSGEMLEEQLGGAQHSVDRLAVIALIAGHSPRRAMSQRAYPFRRNAALRRYVSRRSSFTARTTDFLDAVDAQLRVMR